MLRRHTPAYPPWSDLLDRISQDLLMKLLYQCDNFIAKSIDIKTIHMESRLVFNCTDGFLDGSKEMNSPLMAMAQDR